MSSVAGAAAPAPAVPPGLTLDATLDNPIEVASSAAGDPVSATLAHPVHFGALRIPKGARLLGRILRFEIHVKLLYTLVVVDFTQLELAGARLELHGRLTRFDRIKQLGGSSLAEANPIIARDLRLTGQGWRNPVLFTMGGNLNRIPAGFKMKWETTAPPPPVAVSSDFKTWTNPKDSLQYVWIPPGTFQMGCLPDDDACAADEKPTHPVTIRQGFWLGQTEVTVGAYARFGESTAVADRQQPVVNVSWLDAEAYCLWAGGRLPSEAEWEWAARGGTAAKRYGDLPEIAWYNANSGGAPQRVGQKRPNAYGLHDMLGNVSEWTDDHYEPYSMAVQPLVFIRPRRMDYVTRGGSYGSDPGGLRASARLNNSTGADGSATGFRCITSPPAAPTLLLDGTRWRFRGMDTIVEFLLGGNLRVNTTPLSGHWSQSGNAVTFDASANTQYEMTIAGETMQGVSRRGGTTVVSQLTRMTDVSTPRQPEVPTIASPVPGPEPVQPKATAVIRILEDPTAFPARPPRPGMIMLAPAVFQDHLVRTEAPDYPAQALQDRIQGVVRLHIEMDRAGKITAVEVISGDTLLGQAASDAVRKWILRPFAIDGKEQEAYTEIDISFELKE